MQLTTLSKISGDQFNNVIVTKNKLKLTFAFIMLFKITKGIFSLGLPESLFSAYAFIGPNTEGCKGLTQRAHLWEAQFFASFPLHPIQVKKRVICVVYSICSFDKRNIVPIWPSKRLI